MRTQGTNSRDTKMKCVSLWKTKRVTREQIVPVPMTLGGETVFSL